MNFQMKLYLLIQDQLIRQKIVKEIASEKVKIFDYTWQDDFSDARNYSIQKQVKNGY